MVLKRAFKKLGVNRRDQIVKRVAIGLSCLLLAVSMQAQVLTSFTSDPALPGSTVQITVTLNGSTGKNIQAFGVGLGSGGPAVSGAGSIAAGKTMWANGSTLLFLGVTTATPPIYSATPYGDGVIFSYPFTIPATAKVGSAITVPANTITAVNGAGTVIPTTNSTLILTVGISASCLTVINNNIQSYLANPSAPLVGTLVLEISTAMNTGTCQ